MAITYAIRRLPADCQAQHLKRELIQLAGNLNCTFSIGPIVDVHYPYRGGVEHRATTITVSGSKKREFFDGLASRPVGSNSQTSYIEVDEHFLGVTPLAEIGNPTFEYLHPLILCDSLAKWSLTKVSTRFMAWEGMPLRHGQVTKQTEIPRKLLESGCAISSQTRAAMLDCVRESLLSDTTPTCSGMSMSQGQSTHRPKIFSVNSSPCDPVGRQQVSDLCT